MDGTLIDSRAYWFAVVQDASRHFGGREITLEEFNRTFGQATADDVKQFFPRATVEAANAFYNASLPRQAHHIKLMDGVARVLEQVRALGLKTACATNSPTPFTEQALTAV